MQRGGVLVSLDTTPLESHFAVPQFNCLYRWHATTSRADEKWIEKMGAQLFGDKPIESVSGIFSSYLRMLVHVKRRDSVLAFHSRLPRCSEEGAGDGT